MAELSVATIKRKLATVAKRAIGNNRIVEFKDCYVTGQLNLDYRVLGSPLVFINCVFEQHISMVSACLSALTMRGCVVPSIDAYGLEVEHDLYLWDGFVSFGTVRLINAHVRGRLSFRSGLFMDGNHLAFNDVCNPVAPFGSIDACNLQVDGSCYMDGLRCDSVAWDGVECEMARQAGRFDAIGYRFKRLLGEYSADWMAGVMGTPFIEPSPTNEPYFVSLGLITLRGAEIKGRWYVENARVVAGVSMPISLPIVPPSSEPTENTMDGWVAACLRTVMRAWKPSASIASWQNAHGEVTAQYVRGQFFHPARYLERTCSIDAYCIHVGDSINFTGDVTSLGMLRLSGATLGGKISFKGITVVEIDPASSREIRMAIKAYSRMHSMPRGAIDMFGCTAGGSLYFNAWESRDPDNPTRFRAVGLVGCRNMRIRGRLVVANASFTGCRIDTADPRWELVYDDYSLDCGGSRIDGNLLIRERSNFVGTMRCAGTIVGGRMRISDADFSVFFSEDHRLELLYLNPKSGGLKNDRDVLLAEVSKSRGHSLNVEKMVSDVQFVSFDGAAIQVGRDLFIKGGSRFRGMVDLQYGKIGTEFRFTNASAACITQDLWEKYLTQPVFRLIPYAQDPERTDGPWCRRKESIVLAVDARSPPGEALKIAVDRRSLYALDASNLSCKSLSMAHGKNVGGLPESSACMIGRLILHYVKSEGHIDIRGFRDKCWAACEIHLEHARCAILRDNCNTGRMIRWMGFVYDGIDRNSLELGSGLDGVQRCKRMIEEYDRRCDGEHHAQPFEQLAYVLERMGHMKYAHHVMTQRIRHAYKHSTKARPDASSRDGESNGDQPGDYLLGLSSFFGFGQDMAHRGLGLVFFAPAVLLVVTLLLHFCCPSATWTTIQVDVSRCLELVIPFESRLSDFVWEFDRCGLWTDDSRIVFEMLRILSRVGFILFAWGLSSSFAQRKVNT